MARQIVHIPAQRNIANRAVAPDTKLRVAAYCRVSTEQDEQLNSFENQVTYYTEFINRNPNYELAGIYADVYNQRLIPFDTKMAVKMIK